MPESIAIDSICRLYNRFEGQTAHVIGAAPGVLEELKKYPPRRYNGFVFVLNSSFKLCPEYDIHIIANHEFVGYYGDGFTCKGIAIRPNSFEPTGYEEEFYYYPSKTLFQDFELTQERNHSLMASTSVLVPALHFCLRCNVEKIYVYGVDMRNCRHWDDGTIPDKPILPRFPGRKTVVKHVNFLLSAFPEVKVISLNKAGLLVERRLFEPIQERPWI